MIKNQKKGLHFAIPFSLFILGTLLIAGGLFFILKPYFEMRYVIFSSSSQVIQSSVPVFSTQATSSSSEPSIIYSEFGKVMGSLTIKTAGIIAYPILHGDGNVQLRNGIGQFTGGNYPGEGAKIILDAHRETYFKNLKSVKVGDEVDFKTSYGQYIYKVYSIKILKDTDTSIIAPDNSHEYLVMYTCYPFNTIGYHPQRYVVYATLISGTKVRIPKN